MEQERTPEEEEEARRRWEAEEKARKRFYDSETDYANFLVNIFDMTRLYQAAQDAELSDNARVYRNLPARVRDLMDPEFESGHFQADGTWWNMVGQRYLSAKAFAALLLKAMLEALTESEGSLKVNHLRHTRDHEDPPHWRVSHGKGRHHARPRTRGKAPNLNDALLDLCIQVFSKDDEAGADEAK